ncbi:hypothetical protein ANN_15609 [Periplaneta americana]|uniref:Uncharacterized protein n=1 Tax=Periplaneta americana TaxID=6978 RepID=A0ABQ8SIR6_PERAM|nr:hypothetical protein ANN_15609 [Periplaneta americana]
MSAWTLRKKDESRITANEMKFMRYTAGYMKCDHKRNEDVIEELQLEPVINHVKHYQNNWINHLHCMHRDRIPKVMLHYRPNGKRSPGRPKKRWIENSTIPPYRTVAVGKQRETVTENTHCTPLDSRVVVSLSSTTYSKSCHSDVSSSPIRQAENTALPLRKSARSLSAVCAGEWRKLHNTELHALYSSPDIIRNIKSRRLRWAGHVARMDESRNAYRVLVGRPERKRPLGRPRRRWEVNIKMAGLCEGGNEPPGSLEAMHNNCGFLAVGIGYTSTYICLTWSQATKGNIEGGRFDPVLWIEFGVAQWSERLVPKPRNRSGLIHDGDDDDDDDDDDGDDDNCDIARQSELL